MFRKIVLVIICVTAAGAALLTCRQMRLQAVHDLAEAQRRVAEHDRALGVLRGEIASRTTPARVQMAAQVLGPLSPIDPTWWAPIDPPSGTIREATNRARPNRGSERPGPVVTPVNHAPPSSSRRGVD